MLPIFLISTDASPIIAGINTNATDFLTSLAPLATFLTGLALAFLIIGSLVDILGKKPKMKANNFDDEDDWPEDEYPDDDDLPSIDW